MSKPLSGQVAVVFGATRAAGRGVAEELGLAGASVVCVGRSTRDNPHDGFPGASVEDTAQRVTLAGGQAWAVHADATQPEAVADVFERVRREQGRLDILVNSIWNYGTEGWARPFWQQDKDAGFALIMRTAYAHVLPLIHALPLMAETTGPKLIATISDVLGIGLYDDLAHVMQHRIAESVRIEAERGQVNVTAVTLVPGWIRTEETLAGAGVTESNWQDAIPGDEHWLRSQTPRYTGRAVVALATDPNAQAQHTGKTRDVGDLARLYNFSDTDGRQPTN